MSTRYSIGEVASLLGIPAQTLRFYSTQGLVRPSCLDERTGYRYYSASQFPQIDRIRRLQKFGLNFDQIREALADGRAYEFWADSRPRRQWEMDSLTETVESLDWYLGYYLGG